MGIIKTIRQSIANTFKPLDKWQSPLTTVRRVQIQTTSVCNGKCIICPYPESWHYQNPGRMSDAVFDKIITQIAPLKLDKICPYLENEPFADPAIFERAEAIFKKCSARIVEFSTNAVLLNNNKRTRLAELVQGKGHEIWISFHGVDKERYEGVMGLPFDRALSNVINLLHLADEANLNLVIRCAGIGVDSKLSHNFQCTKEEFDSFWNNIFIKHTIKKRPRMDYFAFHDRAGSIQRNTIHMPDIVRPDLSGFNCPRVSQWIHFLYTGEVILCCMDYHRETVFGDIRKNSLNSIFSGQAFSVIQDSVHGKRDSIDNFICKRCVHPGG